MSPVLLAPPSPFKLRLSLPLVAASGGLMALALPPVSAWPLAWVALVPLWGTILVSPGQPWWHPALHGLVWGLAYYGLSLVWITHLHPLMWLGVPWLGSVAIALAAWIFISLWGASCSALWGLALGLLVRHWPHRVGLRWLAGIALWCGLESLRNQSPLDWSPLSLTQSPGNLWLLHLARLSGPALITAVVVGANGLLAELAHGQWRRSRDRRPQPGQWVWGGIALALLVLTTGAGSLSPQPSLESPGQALSLGLIQGNIPTREKLTPAGVRQALQTYSQGYRALASQGVRAVITPEGALPVIWQGQEPTARFFTDLVHQTGVPLWLGTFAPATAGHGGEYTQSLLELRPDGHIHGRYNKVKLVPLGEYIPLEAVLGRILSRLSPLDSYLVPGASHQSFRSQVGVAAVGICYESAYSELLRRQVRDGAEFMVTIANNDPYPLGMMAQHHALDVLRAVESDRWALRVTNTGLSGLVDNHGQTRWLGPPHRPTFHRASLYRRQSQTLYVRWGNWFTPTLLVITALWAAALRPKTKSP
jgi:apolipoprotein N-acyltransferase